MSIGSTRVQLAQGTDLLGAIRIGLDEAFTALEESFCDLDDEQVADFPVTGRNNIAWIVMHCLQNFDHYANTAPTNDRPMPARALKHDDRYNLWGAPDDQRPKPGDDFPSVRQMLDQLNAVRTSAFAILAERGQANLTRPTGSDPADRHIVADSYMRTIMHTMSHTRQIWALRGVMGAVDRNKAFPRQHWA
jgi:hypothetical protein